MNTIPIFPVETVIVNRIIEDTLGLKRIGSFRLSNQRKSPLPSVLSLLTDVPLPGPFDTQEVPRRDPPQAAVTGGKMLLNLDAYTGAYSNPAFGTFTLCSQSSVLSRTNAENTCAKVISNFTAVFPSLPPRALYASWPRIVLSHIQLIHESNHTFDLKGYSLYPAGYGKDTTPFAEDITGPLNWTYETRFDVVNGKVVGLAFMDSLDGLPGGRKKEGELKDVAYAYFERSDDANHPQSSTN